MLLLEILHARSETRQNILHLYYNGAQGKAIPLERETQLNAFLLKNCEYPVPVSVRKGIKQSRENGRMKPASRTRAT